MRACLSPRHDPSDPVTVCNNTNLMVLTRSRDRKQGRMLAGPHDSHLGYLIWCLQTLCKASRVSKHQDSGLSVQSFIRYSHAPTHILRGPRRRRRETTSPACVHDLVAITAVFISSGHLDSVSMQAGFREPPSANLPLLMIK